MVSILNSATGVALLEDDAFDSMDKTSNKGPKKPAPEPESSMLMWLPAIMMRHAHPGLVQDFEAAEEAKKARKVPGKGKARAKARARGRRLQQR